jgi:hypothetical protein
VKLVFLTNSKFLEQGAEVNILITGEGNKGALEKII